MSFSPSVNLRLFELPISLEGQAVDVDMQTRQANEPVVQSMGRAQDWVFDWSVLL